MKNKNPKLPAEEINYINSVKRMERWHLCQKIGVIYYESPVSYDKLLQVKDYLERRGVVD